MRSHRTSAHGSTITFTFCAPGRGREPRSVRWMVESADMGRTLALLLSLSFVACSHSRSQQNAESTCRELLVFDSNGTGASQLYAFSSRDTRVRQLTHASLPDEYSRVPDVSPDGTTIAFQSRRGLDRAPQIYMMRCDGTSVIRVTNGPEAAAAPAWSPDGTIIAFVQGTSPTAAIYLVSSDGSNLRRAPAVPPNAFYPAWSPDGRQLAFVAQVNESWEVHVADLETGDVRQLTHSPAGTAGCGGPAWSANGLIAFDAIWTGNFAVYVMRADGSNIRRLTETAAVDARPAWSTDGRQIAFHSTRDRPVTAVADDLKYFDIYVMDADGSNIRRITHNTHFDGHPDW